MSGKIGVFGLVCLLAGGISQAADVTIYCQLGGDITRWDQDIPPGSNFYVTLNATYSLDQVYGYMIEANYDQNLLAAVDNDLDIDNQSQWISAGSPPGVSFGGDAYTTYLDGQPVLVNTAGTAIVSVAIGLPWGRQPAYGWHHTIAQVAFVANADISGATPIDFSLNTVRGGVIGTGPEAASVEFIKSCGLTADLDHNNVVNWGDFSIFAGQWLASGRGLSADLDYSEKVNWADFSVFANQWLANCSLGPN